MKKKVFKLFIILIIIQILSIEILSSNVRGLGDIGLQALYPKTASIDVIKNQFFNITLNVSCLTGNCGVIKVSLNPVGTPIKNCEELQNMSKIMLKK